MDIDEWFEGLDRIASALEFASFSLGPAGEADGSTLNNSLTFIYQNDFNYPVGVGSKTWFIGWALPCVFSSIYPDTPFGRPDEEDRRAGPLYTFVARAYELIEDVEMTALDRAKFAAKVMTARVRTGHTRKQSLRK